jgi:hypothetical protein
MIKSLYSSSPFIHVSGGTPQNTYIGHYTGPGVGNLRYNPNSNNIEVFDGSSWVGMVSTSATIGLDENTINILKWAQQKMLEEAERKKLAETNPTIKDLVNQIKDKEEQLSIVQTLIKEEVKV